MSSKSHHRRPPPDSIADPVARTTTNGIKAAENRPDEGRQVTSLAILLTHVVWFFLGPLALLLTLLAIVNVGIGWASLLDVFFFCWWG